MISIVISIKIDRDVTWICDEEREKEKKKKRKKKKKKTKREREREIEKERERMRTRGRPLDLVSVKIHMFYTLLSIFELVPTVVDYTHPLRNILKHFGRDMILKYHYSLYNFTCVLFTFLPVYLKKQT